MLSRLSSIIKEASGAADAEAQAELNAALDVADRIRTFCEDVQVAGNDYHARITTGQIVNLLAGRDANDDGDLLRC